MNVINSIQNFISQPVISQNIVIRSGYLGARSIVQNVNDLDLVGKISIGFISTLSLINIYRFSNEIVEEREKKGLNSRKWIVYSTAVLFAAVPSIALGTIKYTILKAGFSILREKISEVSSFIAASSLGDQLLLMVGSAILMVHVLKNSRDVTNTRRSGKRNNRSLVYFLTGAIISIPMIFFTLSSLYLVQRGIGELPNLPKPHFEFQLMHKYMQIASQLSPIGSALIAIFIVGGIIAQRNLSQEIVKTFPQIQEKNALKLGNHVFTSLASSVTGIAFGAVAGISLSNTLWIAAGGYGLLLLNKIAIMGVRKAQDLYLH